MRLPVAREINGSATAKVVEFTVVVVPETVRLPETVAFPPIVTSSGNPIVIVLFETVVSISFAVPTKLSVSVPTVTTSSEPESPPIVNDELVDAVETLVIRPCASTAITGISEAEPYDPADTAVLSKLCVSESRHKLHRLS